MMSTTKKLALFDADPSLELSSEETRLCTRALRCGAMALDETPLNEPVR